MGQARVRPTRGGGQHPLLLGVEPDLGRRLARVRRARRVQHVLQPADGLLGLRVPVRVHLGHDHRGDRGRALGEVAADPRRAGADLRARLLHPVGVHLRDQERRGRGRGGRLHPDVRRLHRPGPDPVLQLRGVRDPEQRRRRDPEPPAGRAGRVLPRLRAVRAPVRGADPRDPDRPVRGAGHEPRRVPRRDQVRLHGLGRERSARAARRACPGSGCSSAGSPRAS